MSNSAKPSGFSSIVDQVATRLQAWLAGPQSDLAGLDQYDVQRLAADMGMDASTLRDVCSAPDFHRTLMHRMLELHGLDEDKVAAVSYALLRDMQVTCSQCSDAGRCKNDMAKQSPDLAECDSYCRNASTMQALAAAN